MYIKLLIFLFFISFNSSLPQYIIKNRYNNVYDFLESLRLRGIIHYNSEIKPVQRIKLAGYLLEANAQRDKLTLAESYLLERFLLEFELEIKKISGDKLTESKFFITGKRLRLFEYVSPDFSIYADPVLSIEAGSFYDKSLIVRRNGFTLDGYIKENWSYSVKFFDNEESGHNLDKSKRFTRNSAVSISKEKNNSFEYDEVTASVAYTWSDGSISVNKDYLTFGSGNFGKIILSDKAPPFPFIRFDFYPVEWLSFFYFHGFLQSNVPDSNTFRYNSVPGRTTILEVPKYIAFHSFSFYPTDYLAFTLGESIVYSERIQPIYFIPVMFFRVADHYLGTDNASATGNAQMFLDASYLNKDIQTKFYSSLFIDELSFNSLFEGGNLSAIGYTVGAESYNILPMMKFYLEYTRINPFVYMNSVDAQLYSNDGYKMGHWIESNGDIFSFGIKKIFNAAISAELNLWYFRKGKTEAAVEQYSSPYPEFLYGVKRYEKGLEINMRYSPVLPVNVELNYLFTDVSDEEMGRTQQFKLGKKNSFIIKLSYQM